MFFNIYVSFVKAANISQSAYELFIRIINVSEIYQQVLQIESLVPEKLWSTNTCDLTWNSMHVILCVFYETGYYYNFD